tara:strand:- start:86716 stop:87363 length:648 start_codon:yes stop_codon:yes gene_type:complete
MKKFLKFAANASGSTMIQTMMIAAIIGAMAIMNLTIMNQQNKANKKTDDMFRSENVTSTIAELLTNPDRCRHFLGDKSPNMFDAGGGVYGQYVDADLDDIVEPGEEAIIDDRRVISSDAPAAAGPSDYSVDDNVLYKTEASATASGVETNYNGLYIINFQISPKETPVANKADLVIFYFPARVDNYYQADTNVSGTIPLHLEFDSGGHITNCYAE